MCSSDLRVHHACPPDDFVSIMHAPLMVSCPPSSEHVPCTALYSVSVSVSLSVSVGIHVSVNVDVDVRDSVSIRVRDRFIVSVRVI